MRRFYLDTNVLIDLTETGNLSWMAERIRRLLQARAVEILGSLELLGELVPRAHEDRDGYKRMLDMFWALCGPRVLHPWNELIRSEIQKGHRLSIREAYLDSSMTGSAHQLSYNPAANREWAEGVQERKAEYEETMRCRAAEFEKTAIQRWGAKEVRKSAADLTITRERINDWGRALLIRPDPSRHGLSNDEATWPDLSALPCARAYVAMTLAWRRKCHEAKRKDTGADFYDSMHYVIASMTDALVTNDKALRHAIGLIEWKPTQVLTPNELGRMLNRM